MRISQSIAVWLLCLTVPASAAKDADDLPWPPKLPGGETVVRISGRALLKPGPNLRPDVTVAKTPPEVEVLYYPGQNYPGNPWSVWGDGLAVDGKYYSAIGDHKSPEGNAFVYEYDSATKKLRLCVDLRKTLKQPNGHYTPGKIHSRIDQGSDGWLYFSTHRGSTRVAFDPKAHFRGDWILRHHPEEGKTEIVAHAPLPVQCMPCGMLDPDRLIFYAGTADGLNEKKPQFLAYDVKGRKILYSDPHGPYRYLIFARSTGKVYFHGKTSSPSRTDGPAPLVRFDPEKLGPPVPIPARCGLRAATMETPQGRVYTIDHDALWSFDTKTEKVTPLGPSAVASKTYTASIDADMATGRYLYYVPGAHGGAEQDGTPVIQYDLKTRTRKVIAFLHPAVYDRTGYIPVGTYSTAVSPGGDKLYVTFNGNRGTAREDLGKRIRFNTCAMTVIHIPASEREP